MSQGLVYSQQDERPRLQAWMWVGEVVSINRSQYLCNIDVCIFLQFEQFHVDGLGMLFFSYLPDMHDFSTFKGKLWADHLSASYTPTGDICTQKLNHSLFHILISCI